jgi:RimJ/RimL family protein N-acetyltransferase
VTATSLGDDGAELRPLEPWHAEEFLAHLEAGGSSSPGTSGSGRTPPTWTPPERSSRGYADKRAAESGGFLHGLWLDGKLVGGLLFRVFDAAAGNCELGCRLEPAAAGRGPATRGARVLIDRAFDERGMHRVEW